MLVSIVFLLAISCAPPPTPASTPTSLPTSAIPPTPTSIPRPTTQPPNNRTTQPPRSYAAQIHDAHLHYSQDSKARYSISEIQAILDKVGIKRALISSTPNEGTLDLHAADPARFVPEIRPYRLRDDIGRWSTLPEMIPFVEQGLTRAPYRAIGEFHLYGDEAKLPFVKRIVEIAVERNLVLHAHSDEAAVEGLLMTNPRARVLWAHTGMSTPIATVEKMLERYPNLYAELALRYDVSQYDKLDPAWRVLFLKFPDRFMYGTDTWVESRWEALPSAVSTARAWLGELPEEVAAKIAYRNFEALFIK